MVMTAIEKILSRHLRRNVREGEFVVVPVDVVMAQDGNAPLVIQILKGKLRSEVSCENVNKIFVIDHCAPSPNMGASNLQKMMREYANDHNITLYDTGEGVSHVLLPEKGHIKPGDIIVGSDSHSVTYGALNCFATGMGATDIAVAMRTGKIWIKVPRTQKIYLHGCLKKGVFAKDLVLHLIKTIGVNGASYECLEFEGDGLASLSIEERFTICNMVVEMGAKCAIMPPDKILQTYIEDRHLEQGLPVWSDDGCNYSKVVHIDMSTIEPLVALPHSLCTILPASEVKNKIDIAFVGTCTNSRISDLEEVAKILDGKKIHKNVRMIIAPGSRKILQEAIVRGWVSIFLRAGAMVTPPGCAACVGTHMGIPGDGEIVISTGNRNFQGRMGNSNAYIYLASPSTVAISALAGEITTSIQESKGTL